MSTFMADDAEYRRRSREIAALKEKEPKLDAAIVLREMPPSRARTHLFIKGDFTRPAAIP